MAFRSQEFRHQVEQYSSVLSLAQAAELSPEVQALVRKTANLESANVELQRQLNWLKNYVFGVRSEQRAAEKLSPADQFLLGLEILPATQEPPSKSTTVAEYERQQRKKPITINPEAERVRFGPGVPREVVIVEDPETAALPDDQKELVSETVLERVAQQPAYKVVEIRTRIYKRKDTGVLATVNPPRSVIPGSIFDVSFVSGMLIDKYLHHIPLYRQHERMLHVGIDVNRGNLTRILHRAAQMLEPIYQAIRSSILAGDLISADESPTPAGLKKGQLGVKGEIHRGYFWVLYGSRDEILFHYSPSRSATVLDDILEGFQGTLLTDGYAAYTSFVSGQPGVVHAQCWTHSRRNFIEAEPVAPEPIGWILKAMSALYAIERQADRGSPELLELRQRQSVPLVDSLFTFLQKQLDQSVLLPSSPFTKAIRYMLERRAQLEVFLNDPNVPLDTNHVERAIRPSAVGRKNWMFNFTEAGARYSAVIYTLLQSCVVAGVHPGTYLTDVLQRIQLQPMAEITDMIPRRWAQNFGQNPLGPLAGDPVRT